jgi:hypothetical protein
MYIYIRLGSTLRTHPSLNINLFTLVTSLRTAREVLTAAHLHSGHF